MTHILMLEPNRENVPHLVFLLKLAGIRCTVARNLEEVVNWLSAHRLMVAHFDLVLLNSLSGLDPEKKLLDDITGSTTVPLVYVQRDGSYLPQISGEGIILCHPDNLLSCLRECLDSEDKRPKPEKKPTSNQKTAKMTSRKVPAVQDISLGICLAVELTSTGSGG